MPITFTHNYKETLEPKVVEIIDNFVEDGYDIQEVLTTYDYFGEEYSDNLKEIFDVLENTGASRSDLYDFVDDYGVDNLQYFEKYLGFSDDCNQDAVDAFISLYGVSSIEDFWDAYVGYYNTVDDFVEEMMENMGTEIPSWLCVDYQATWNSSLRFCYDEEDGYYFHSNW